MNILFIYPSINLGRWVNYGIASLCGVISSRGHTVDLYQPITFEIEEIESFLKGKEYGLCLISSVTNQWPYALRYLRLIKSVLNVPVVVGGHHPTNCPAVFDEHREIDGLCIGEGETVIDMLLACLEQGREPNDIPGLCFRDGERVFKNDVGDLVQNLDALPLPDYSPFAMATIQNRPSLIFSRGCPYRCSYCCNNNLRKIYAGKGEYVRKKSVARALEEVQKFIMTYQPAILNFDDDTFIKDRKWTSEFLSGYQQLTDTPFNCNSRPETIDAEICRELKAANCKSFCIGIESGSERFRREKYGRRMSNQLIIEAFNHAHKAGLETYAFNMVGAPDETFADYLETVHLNQSIMPTGLQMTIYYPYPGSELYSYACANKSVDDKVYADNFICEPMLNMKQFPKWKIRYAAQTFQFRVYEQDRHWLAKRLILLGFLLKNIYWGFKRATPS